MDNLNKEVNNLNVSFSEFSEGINLIEILTIKRNEKYTNFFDLGAKSSNGAEDTFRIFNDSNKSYGLIRSLVGATIFEGGRKSYNLGDIVGRKVIINLENAVSKNGNNYWKVKGFEKVTEDTNLDQFEFQEETESSTYTTLKLDEVNDVSDIEDLLEVE